MCGICEWPTDFVDGIILVVFIISDIIRGFSRINNTNSSRLLLLLLLLWIVYVVIKPLLPETELHGWKWERKKIFVSRNYLPRTKNFGTELFTLSIGMAR